MLPTRLALYLRPAVAELTDTDPAPLLFGWWKVLSARQKMF